jgi:DNA mismatch endonuclease Vsr
VDESQQPAPADEQPDRLRVVALPAKRFFVGMLVKDIELVPAIVDLVDNSVDGAKRLRPRPDGSWSDGFDQSRYAGLKISITVDAEHFASAIPWAIARRTRAPLSLAASACTTAQRGKLKRCTAAWAASSSTAQTTSNPACSKPRARPPAPQNKSTAIGRRGIEGPSATLLRDNEPAGTDEIMTKPADATRILVRSLRLSDHKDPPQALGHNGVVTVPPPPPPSSATAHKVMCGNSSDSGLERALRCALHRHGLRFRKHLAPIRGLRCRPDVVFTRARLAVFVDGCFWHRCPLHGSAPKGSSVNKSRVDAVVPLGVEVVAGEGDCGEICV